MKVKKLFSFSFCFLFLVGILFALNSEDQFQNRKARDNIMTLWLLKMTQVLDLTDEQTAKIFPAVRQTEKEKMEIQKEIGQKMRELRLILKNEKPEEKEIEGLIKDLKRLRDLVKSKDEELEEFLEKNLTLVQRAKYLVFAVDFMRGMRERLSRARGTQERFKEKNRNRF